MSKQSSSQDLNAKKKQLAKDLHARTRRKATESQQRGRNRVHQIDPEMPGAKLVYAIDDAMIKQRKTITETAQEMGFTATELSRYRNGRQSTLTISRVRLESIAAFIGMPYLAVLLLSEQLKPSDFYLNSTDDNRRMTLEIERACQYVLSDPEWGAIVPASILDQNVSPEWRIFVVWCYEKATNRVLIPGAVDYIDMIERLDKQAE